EEEEELVFSDEEGPKGVRRNSRPAVPMEDEPASTATTITPIFTTAGSPLPPPGLEYSNPAGGGGGGRRTPTTLDGDRPDSRKAIFRGKGAGAGVG
ncbi:unnamed protein product, partial [Discosporangium mesarthrocarpum]